MLDKLDYSQYPLKTRTSIRLVQIVPLGENENAFGDEVALRMRVVDLHPQNLVAGESMVPSGRPTVRFDEEVSYRPTEHFGVSAQMLSKLQKKQAEEQHGKKWRDKKRSRLDRMVSKIVGGPPDELVPVTTFLNSEPIITNRWSWGNYVAMSYSWGEKEAWEEKTEGAEKKGEDSATHPEEPASSSGTVVLIDSCRVRIRYNLWAALISFRNMGPFKMGVWLWNDALCINQSNQDEKVAQIKMMSTIYRQAGNIIVHAGVAWHDDEDTPWVIEYLQDISTNYRTEYVEAMDSGDAEAAHVHRESAQRSLVSAAWSFQGRMRKDLYSRAKESDNDKSMISLYDFFNRPYWRRLWIIQELAMGHASMPIVIGDFVTQWRYVRDAAQLLCWVADDIRDSMQRALARKLRTMENEPSFQHVAAIAQLAMLSHRKTLPPRRSPPPMSRSMLDFDNSALLPPSGPFSGSPVGQALALASQSLCEKPYDKVNGLLAIPALAGLHVEPSYDLASLGELYMNFTEECVAREGALEIIALADGTSSHIEGLDLPSWCPDYACKLGNRISRIHGRWCAGGTPIFRQNLIAPRGAIKDKMLHCMGWLVDAVDGLGAISESEKSQMKPRSLFQAGVVQPKFSPEWPEDGISNEVWRTFVGGTRVDGHFCDSKFKSLLSSFPETLTDSNFPYIRNWNFLQANGSLTVNGRRLDSYFTFQPRGYFKHPFHNFHNELYEGESEPVEYAAAHQAMEARTRMRRIMTTANNGMMGLVPASTQPGDGVFIIAGHRVPVIAKIVVLSDADRGRVPYEYHKLKLKGEAYIEGMMEGEMFDRINDDNIEPLVFY